MLKDRLYYIDAYRTEFEAAPLSAGEDETGRPYIILDQTAFYPTGGGQPHDTGTIGGVRVTDVEEVDGEVRHYTETPFDAENLPSALHAVIDWERRFDHMQQHAGQHILTAAFVELFGFQTVSFHLGREAVSIDLDTEEVTEEQLQQTEKLANAIIQENRPIETIWVNKEEAAAYPLRKEIAAEGEIRLVIIPSFDYNGCGGTHPASTGEVGMIKILSVERQKKMARIHFVCGGRVLAQLHRYHSELTEISRLISAPVTGAAAAVAQLQNSSRQLEKDLDHAKETILSYEAEALLHAADNGRIEKVFTDRPVQELQKLARLITNSCEKAIVLFAAEQADKLQFVAARGNKRSESMKIVAEAARTILNGKGGGSDLFVQGGGDKIVSANRLLQAMAEAIG